jgi:hypothetical protein
MKLISIDRLRDGGTSIIVFKRGDGSTSVMRVSGTNFATHDSSIEVLNNVKDNEDYLNRDDYEISCVEDNDDVSNVISTLVLIDAKLYCSEYFKADLMMNGLISAMLDYIDAPIPAKIKVNTDMTVDDVNAVTICGVKPLRRKT